MVISDREWKLNFVLKVIYSYKSIYGNIVVSEPLRRVNSILPSKSSSKYSKLKVFHLLLYSLYRQPSKQGNLAIEYIIINTI